MGRGRTSTEAARRHPATGGVAEGFGVAEGQLPFGPTVLSALGLPGSAQGPTCGVRRHTLRGHAGFQARRRQGSRSGVQVRSQPGSLAAPGALPVQTDSQARPPTPLAWQDAREQGSRVQALGPRGAPACPGWPPAALESKKPPPARHNSDKGLSGVAGGAQEGSPRAVFSSSGQPHLTSSPRGWEGRGHLSLRRLSQGGSNLGASPLEGGAPRVALRPCYPRSSR